MKAMILAAGEGRRMRPLTLSKPKPLLPVAGKPLIEYHLQRLQQAGFRELVVNHAWLGEQLVSFLADSRREGLKISLSAETQALETAGGICKALPLLADAGESFVVVNGDVFTNYPFTQLRPLPAGKLAHLILVENPAHNPQGDFNLSAGMLNDNSGPRYTFSGISVLSPQLFAGLNAGEPAALGPLLRRAIAAGQVSGEYFDGFWTDVGTPQRLAEVEQMVLENRIDGV
ncbi:N-acetylmuramate alpha-1-phosphate uridylyltransferase MurU [Marinobacterium jannaschii]|uniref:N-acetylmuramate alpha-1-phosphate uridylyltransferase MurU n=1 Tax=Marinobacterium jannaschii TaxID=64970 RepID=UPI0004808AF3|nr:nucleotidyltransferase family protein [Marinobacterium jannaschii]